MPRGMSDDTRDYLLDIMEYEMLNDVPLSHSYFGPMKYLGVNKAKSASEEIPSENTSDPVVQEPAPQSIQDSSE